MEEVVMGQMMRGVGVGRPQRGSPGRTSSRVFRTETGISTGTLPRWSAGWELGMEPEFQVAWPVRGCQPPQTKRKLLVWVGGDPHGWGWAGGQAAWSLWLRGAPMQGWHQGGLVGMGSTVPGTQGPKGRDADGHGVTGEHSSRAPRRKQGFPRS